MIRSRRLKPWTWVILLLLASVQGGMIGIASSRQIVLIYDWMFYAINYIAILLIALLYTGNRYVRGFKWMTVLVLLTANTAFLDRMGDVNVLFVHTEDQRHELILKEYPKTKDETVRLQRKGLIFGKKTAVLTGSSDYKAIDNGRFKTEWINDMAVVTYPTGSDGTLEQRIFSYRSSDYISYQYVMPGLRGKWMEQDHPQNYILFKQNEIVHVSDGKLTYYRNENAVQQGIFSLVIYSDAGEAEFSVIMNPDSVFDNNGTIIEAGTITWSPVTLKEAENKVYYKAPSSS